MNSQPIYNSLRMEENVVTLKSNLRHGVMLVLGFLLFSLSPAQAQSHLKSDQAELAFANLNTSDYKVIEAKVTRKSLGTNKTQIHYIHNNTREISPYKVEYDYVQTDHGSYMELPMMSFLEEFDLYLDESVSIVPDGKESVTIDKQLSVGQKLTEASASYDIISNDIKVISYDLSLLGREVVEEKEITFQGVKYRGYVILSQFRLRKVLADGKELQSNTEWLKDWFIPSIGIVKRQRLSTSKNDSESEIAETQF